jgi:DNA anti-recombination protein RmuC
MSNPAMSFNPFDYIDELTKGGFTKEQAESQARAQIKLVQDISDNHLAKKRDLHEVETKLENRINEVETKLENRINEVETKLENRINEVETKLSTRIDKLEARMDTLLLKMTIRLGSIAAIGVAFLSALIKF